MPGRLDRFVPTDRIKRCPDCGGWDMGNIGLIHHKADCPRNPCMFCSLPILDGEKATYYYGRRAHYDCAADFELDRIEDQEERRA